MDERELKIAELKNIASALRELENQALDIMGMILTMQREIAALIDKLEIR